MGRPDAVVEEVTEAPQQELFAFLNSMLHQLEEDEGELDLELRGKIDALKAETERLPPASASTMSDVELASELEVLEKKLASLEESVSEFSSNAEVQRILQGSASLWMPVITASTEERRNILSPPAS